MTPTGAPGLTPIQILGRAVDPTANLQADVNIASDGYFEALGVPILRGRAFRPGDTAGSPPVVVINATLAKKWQGEDPIGSRIGINTGGPAGTPNPEFVIVGVTADFHLYGATTDLLPQLFLPLRQAIGLGFGGAGRLIVRAAADPAVLGATIRDAVHGVAADVPVSDVSTLAGLKRDQLSVPALTAGLLMAFATVALVITLAGIAGVIGTAVTQRTREFGVRLALGARPWSIVRMVVSQGLLLVALGILVGVAGAYGFSQILSRFLFQTRPTDAMSYLVVGGLFLSAAAFAALVPARRIVGIDPLKVLRND